jgi:outer membrane protein W
MTYRPILTDFNAVFQPKLGKKIGLDLFGGIGVASTRFYVPEITQCNIGGCINYTSSDHFMEDFGGGLRYYVWHHVFVRPEVHYYHIQNNVEFNSDNVVRVGGSIGYTIGND